MMFDVHDAGVHGVTCESGEHLSFICKTDDNFLKFVFWAVENRHRYIGADFRLSR